jgi:hypothetical protein
MLGSPGLLHGSELGLSELTSLVLLLVEGVGTSDGVTRGRLFIYNKSTSGLEILFLIIL